MARSVTYLVGGVDLSQCSREGLEAAIVVLIEQRNNIATFRPFSQTRANESAWIRVMDERVASALEET